METIPFPLIIIIFAVQAIRCHLQCDVTEQLDKTCGTYCLQVVKPLLSHAKASLERPDDKIDQILTKFESIEKRLDKVESMEKRLDKVDQILTKFETIEKRLDKVDSIEKRLDKVDQILTKVDSVEKRLDKVDQIPSKVESMEKRLDGYEQYFRILLYPDFRKIGDNYYYISTSRESFYEAKKKCNLLGAHLVWFKSSLKLNLVAEHLTSDRYWIDVNHWYANGNFIGFRSWHYGEPSGDGKCVELKLVDKVYGMNDLECHYAREFICEL